MKSVVTSWLVMTLCLIGLDLTAFTEMAQAKNLTCARCGKTVTQTYIKAENLVFHPQCLICSLCGKAIKGPFSLDNKDLYHPSCYAKAKGLVCSFCGKTLGSKWVEADGKKYHADCYKNKVQLHCDICGKPIVGKYIRDDGIFHEDCYKAARLPSCVVCSKPIEGRHVVDYWGNNAHPEHHGKEVQLCGSCGRIISEKSSEGGFRYDDGRLICGICRRTAVTNLNNMEQMKNEVLSLLSTVGLRGIPLSVPVVLVDKGGLKRQSGPGYSDSSRGFTRSLDRQINGQTQSRDHTIFILNGLPSLEFKGILAHELLHVWLSEHDAHLSTQNTEGFCNLGMMLVNQSDSSDFAKALQQQLETNSDPVYGKGYRTMKKKLDAIGWTALIQRTQSSR